MFSIWVNQRKRKEEINLNQSSLRDSKPEREEHLFSTQLISQEKNPATEINHFEGSGLKWLVPKGTPPPPLFFFLGRRQDFWEGEREITYWCMLAELTLSFSFLSFLCFSVFSLIFPFSSFFLVTPCFYFLVFNFSILSSFSPLLLLLLLYTARASFYSAYRD